jgi:hypothetical protein
MANSIIVGGSSRMRVAASLPERNEPDAGILAFAEGENVKNPFLSLLTQTA